MGVSMGAATVLLAAGLNLPDNVCGIVADCGYTSAEEITRKCLPEYLPHTPVRLAYAVGRLGARLYGHFEPNRIDCTAAVSRATVPILFIHGEEDGFVPCEMSRKNKITVVLSGVNPKVHNALQKAGFYRLLGEKNICPDINVALARARQILEKTA